MGLAKTSAARVEGVREEGNVAGYVLMRAWQAVGFHSAGVSLKCSGWARASPVALSASVAQYCSVSA